MAALAGYRTLECHVVLYPYSRRITSNDFTFHPFEEYARDVGEHRRSAYAPLESAASHVFGLAVGALLAVVAHEMGTERFLTLEALLALLGAYFIGKDLWADVERWLIEGTKALRLRYLEPIYRYRLEKHHTLTRYSTMARRERYGRAAILPERLDLIEHSSSETVRLEYRMRDVFRDPAIGAASGAPVHLLSIHLDPDLAGAMEESGYMLGIKLSFNRGFGPFERSVEVFQSVHRYARGCLDDAGRWIPDAAFCRRTFRLGRIKWFAHAGVAPECPLIALPARPGAQRSL